MAKLFTFIFSCLFSVVLTAQDSIVKSYQMPIYPTCDKIKDNDERLNCFQKNLTSIYTKHLEKHINAFEYLNIPEAEAKVILELNQNGELILKYIESNSSVFRAYNFLAFEEFKKELVDKKINITPAKSLDGKELLSMLVSFPVGFKLNKPIEETNARLISVLDGDNATYNIYLTPNKDFKVYEVSDNKQPVYLGKFLSIQELKNTLPYKDIINKTNGLITLVQSDFGKVKILLQVLNVFNEDEFYTLFVVSEVKGKKVKQLRKYTSINEFYTSPYYDWLIKEY